MEEKKNKQQKEPHPIPDEGMNSQTAGELYGIS